jgi:2-dehydropantoate 2-reductase
MEPKTWPKVALLGAGAVGCYFGGMLARAGAPVTLIGRAHHVGVLTRDGLWLDALQFQERIAVTASVDVAAACDAAIVLFCVKTYDTEKAAKALAPHLAADVLVLSLQNGVDNVERIRAASGLRALPVVVYVAAAMTGPGRVKHTGRGDLIIGDPQGGSRLEMEHLATLFTCAGIPCAISENIEAELWTKMSMNCAFNAVSALGRAKYGRIVKHLQARELLRLAVEETAAVARASGVHIEEAKLVEAAYRLGEAMSGATSSTAQDIERGKLTEIDSLNGYVACRGADLGVPTPVNRTLHALVKLLEGATERL